MEQNFENPYKKDQYTFIHAGASCSEIEFPDGTKADGVETEFNLGLSHLFDWTTNKKTVNKWIQLLKDNPEAKNKLVIDCGAFSFWSTGKPFDMEKYIEWLNEDHKMKYIYWAVSVDKIVDDDAPTEEMVAAQEETWNNYLYMIKRVEYPKKLLPVYHKTDDISCLERILNFTFEDGEHIPYICVATHIKDINARMRFYDKVMDFIKHSNNPDVKVHFLGDAKTCVVGRYDITTSDASSYMREGVFGTVSVGKNKYSVGRKLGSNHIVYQPDYIKQELQSMLNDIGHGLTIDNLADSSEYLKLVNMYSGTKFLNELGRSKKKIEEPKKLNLW